MGQLLSVSDYVSQARTLLQDLVPPYRYDDESLVTALNMAYYEVDRLRPDLSMAYRYLGRVARTQRLSAPNEPAFQSTVQAVSVQLPQQVRMAVLYFIVGYAQLRDTEDTQDSRAAAFMNKFTAELMSLT